MKGKGKSAQQLSEAVYGEESVSIPVSGYTPQPDDVIVELEIIRCPVCLLHLPESEFRTTNGKQGDAYRYRACTLCRRLKIYGLTRVDFFKILDYQNGRCAICQSEDSGHTRFSVDHSHATGKIRGLLCQSCNHMLGHAKDSPQTLRIGAEYLEKNNG